jgi:hypothetical protein
VSVTSWLLEGDPAIRWQALRDLVNAPASEVAAGRARVEHDGWGARLLALEDPDGLWDGGACFPASYAGGEPGQPWTATMHTLQTLQLLGLDPASRSARRAIGLVARNGRWEHAGQRYFDGEAEPCINGRTIQTGAYFGVDVAAVAERILAERLGASCAYAASSLGAEVVLDGHPAHHQLMDGAAAQPPLHRGDPAKKLVVLAGSRRALAAAVRTKGAGRRHTALARRPHERAQ